MTERRTLCRTLRVGDAITLDGGRIVVHVLERTGRTARLRFELDDDVVVHKPTAPAEDRAQQEAGAFA